MVAWEFLVWLFHDGWLQGVILVPVSALMFLGWVVWMDSRRISRITGGQRTHRQHLD